MSSQETPASEKTVSPQKTNAGTFAADDVRIRERRRYAAMPAWQVISIVAHVVLIAVFVWFTPIKEMLAPEKEVKRERTEIDPDRIERLSYNLQTVRLNELLRQLEDLQSILYNMEMMRNEILADYDAFSAHQEGEVRVSMAQLLDRVVEEQERVVADQKTALAAATEFSTWQVRDITDTNIAHQLRASNAAFSEPVHRVESAQANAQNLIDKVAVEAEFIGLARTTAEAVKLRDAQIEANTLQRDTRRNIATKTTAIVTDYPRAVTAISNLTVSIAKNEGDIVILTQRIEQRQTDVQRFATEADELAKTLERLNAEHAAAQEKLGRSQERLEALAAPTPPPEEV